jgi:hypothetical protein
MYPIIEQMAEELDLSEKQACCAFTIVIARVLMKVPQLEQLMDSIFSNADPEEVSNEIDKMMFRFQQHKMEIFLSWTMPEETMIIHAGKNDIL